MAPTPERRSLGAARLRAAGRPFGYVLVIATVCLGVVLIVHTLISTTDAPLPPQDFAVGDVEPSEVTGTNKMTPDRMGPSHLFVPALDIYAPTRPMAVRRGSLDLPANPAVIGWDRSSAGITSEQGSSLLVGHVRSGRQEGALLPLASAAAGDRVYVTDSYGQLTAWVVTALETVRAGRLDPTIFEATGPRRLTIVTCAGPVTIKNGVSRYRDNVVLTAVPEGLSVT